jgi:hypothetical protein
MRLRSSIAVICLGALLGGGSARAEPEFVGVIATSSHARFAIALSPNSRPQWIGLGDAAAGCKVTAYDAAAEIVTVVVDGRTLRLPLKADAKVKESRLEVVGDIKAGPGGAIATISRATLLLDQENVLPLADGAIIRFTPRRLDGTKMRFDAAYERPDAGGSTERIAAPSVITIPGTSFAIQVGDFHLSFSAKVN